MLARNGEVEEREGVNEWEREKVLRVFLGVYGFLIKRINQPARSAKSSVLTQESPYKRLPAPSSFAALPTPSLRPRIALLKTPCALLQRFVQVLKSIKNSKCT